MLWCLFAAKEHRYSYTSNYFSHRRFEGFKDNTELNTLSALRVKVMILIISKDKTL